MILFAAAILLAQSKPLTWKTATFPGGYTVDVPAPLSKLPRQIDKESGLITDSWVATKDLQNTYYISFTWDPAGKDKTPAHQVLGQVTNALTADAGCLIRSQKDVVLKGWPGIETEYTNQYGVTTRFRGFMVNGKLFESMATRPSGKQDDSGSTEFLYSMNLPKSLGIGPQKTAGPEYATYPLGGISVRLPSKPEKEAQNVGSGTQVGAMTRYQSLYGNRVYLCIILDIPDEAMDETQDHEQEILETLNSQMFDGMHAKGQSDSHYKLGKNDVMSSTGKVNTNFGVRADTFLTGQRVYSFVAVTPLVMQKSDEVKAFFSSVKLD